MRNPNAHGKGKKDVFVWEMEMERIGLMGKAVKLHYAGEDIVEF